MTETDARKHIATIYCLLYSPDGGKEEYRSVVLQCREYLERECPEVPEIAEMLARLG